MSSLPQAGVTCQAAQGTLLAQLCALLGAIHESRCRYPPTSVDEDARSRFGGRRIRRFPLLIVAEQSSCASLGFLGSLQVLPSRRPLQRPGAKRNRPVLLRPGLPATCFTEPALAGFWSRGFSQDPFSSQGRKLDSVPQGLPRFTGPSMIRARDRRTGLWLKPSFEKPAKAGSASPHPDNPALDRSNTRVPGTRFVWEGESPSANLMEVKASEAQGRHREVGSEGSVEQTDEPTHRNWISRRQGRTSQLVVRKSVSIKVRKRKSSGCVLSPGGLGRCPSKDRCNCKVP